MAEPITRSSITLWRAERDAALASLAELRTDVRTLFLNIDSGTSESIFGEGSLEERLRHLATATPGRGEKLVAVVEAARRLNEAERTGLRKAPLEEALADAIADLDAGGAAS